MSIGSMRALAALAILTVAASAPGAAPRTSRDAAMPAYTHIFVIVEENKGYDITMDHPQWTPVIHRLAAEYGSATQFYAEAHPSEPNYVAMVGGGTFGIHDDDAFYCRHGLKDPFCPKSGQSDYADHDLSAPSLADQLAAKGMSWKAYMEDIPSAGSLAPRWPTAAYPGRGGTYELYAAKHNGFVNFRSVNREPFVELEQHFVGFTQLDRDLAADTLPNYAHIVPNQCNEMHGRSSKDGPNTPADCIESNTSALIERGDTEVGVLVDKIMRAKVWRDSGNVAIVVTFDENDGAARKTERQGCCGYDPHSKTNFGGGHIPTIIITNHGPRHVADPTPYNHYSLLRTTEAAFGIKTYLGHAADTAKGVVAMTPLFAVR